MHIKNYIPVQVTAQTDSGNGDISQALVTVAVKVKPETNLETEDQT